MSIQNGFERPDFSAINAAYRLAEQNGYIDPNQRPVGSLSLDEVYAACSALTMTVGNINGMQPATHDRHSNGYGGTSKTRRSPLGKNGTTTHKHPVLDGLAEFDASIAAEVAKCVEPEREWTTIDENGDERLVWEFGQLSADDIAYRQRLIEEKAAKERPALHLSLLHRQGYANGMGTAPSKEEREQADRVLRQKRRYWQL